MHDLLLATLVAIKIIAAVLATGGVAVGIGWVMTTAMQEQRGRWLAVCQAAILGALGLLLLVRGAPHNNPLIYGVYENFGVIALAATILAVYGLGIAAGMRFAIQGHLPLLTERVTSAASLGLITGIFALLAGLSALEEVVRYWDVSGWGDTIFWDRLTHLIARGELAAGHSYYMPIFQYGAAALYKVFGHSFWVMQISNVLWAPVTVVFACLAVRYISVNPWLVVLIGALTSSHDYLRYTAHIMQIENWYIPLLSIAIWAAVRWQRTQGWKAAVILGIAAGLVFETRSHGAFGLSLFLLAPLLLAKHLPWHHRIGMTFISGVTFIAMLTPWTLRNYTVENRLALAGTQGPAHMVMSSYPQTFYGIRRNLGGPEIMRQWQEKYPDAAKRDAAMKQHVIDHIVNHPDEVLKGAAWRSLAFYGLLPAGVWAEDGPQPTDWRATGKEWLLRNMATLCLIFAAGLGVFLRRDRMGVFLLAGIAGNMAPVFVAGFTEARIHYPVLLLFFLLALGGLGAQRQTPETVLALHTRPLTKAAALILGITVIMGLFARGDLYRPLMEPGYQIKQSLPASNQDFLRLTPSRLQNLDSASPLTAGQWLEITGAITNHKLPVKWYAENLGGFPAFASDPKEPSYFRVYLTDANNQYRWGVSPVIAVSFAKTISDNLLREDTIVRIQGRIRDIGSDGRLYIDATSVKKLGKATSSMRHKP